jgi:hypothetical protein
MTPDGLPFRGVTEGARDPDGYFAERGFLLRVAERDLDSQLPPDAPSRGSTHWADLISARSGEVVAPSYGAGQSTEEAKSSALRRWIEEQEPPTENPQR